MTSDLQHGAVTVWYGKMPESNGRQNWTAMLKRNGGDAFEAFADGYTFARSEYPDRVRYEADQVRWLLGEIAERPCLLDYDADLHSGYAAPAEQPAPDVREGKTPGQIAYDAFAIVLGTSAVWRRLPFEYQTAWEAAASALIEVERAKVREALEVALSQAKRGADKAGCDGWRAQEMCRQIVPLIEKSLAALSDGGE